MRGVLTALTQPRERLRRISYEIREVETSCCGASQPYYPPLNGGIKFDSCNDITAPALSHVPKCSRNLQTPES